MHKGCGLLISPQEKEVIGSESADGFWLLLTVRAGPRGRLSQGAQGQIQETSLYISIHNHIQRAGQGKTGSPGAEGRADVRNELSARRRC